MSEDDLRDFFAACAMIGMVMRNGLIDEIGSVSYEIADKMIASKNSRGEGGIVSIRTPIKRRKP